MHLDLSKVIIKEQKREVKLREESLQQGPEL